MFIEVHMLKNYPATNLNRDDAGMPKNCLFGGVQRGRISSQCLKRSWRESVLLRKEIGEENFGIRTRKLYDLVCDELTKKGISSDYFTGVSAVLAEYGLLNEAKKISDQIIFYAHSDVMWIVSILEKFITEAGSAEVFNKWFTKVEKKKKKGKKDESVVAEAEADASAGDKFAEFKKAWDAEMKDGVLPVSVDIALFGRMVTSKLFADVDSAIQVAHAVSVNKIVMESDFFSAMDDMLKGGDELGAAYIDDADFNSSCYYEYASLDVDKLKENLQGIGDVNEVVTKLIPALLNTMALTNPGGKQNSYAGNVLPSAILVECKEYPVALSYVNAFENPARPVGGESLVSRATKQLKDHVKVIDEAYNLPLVARYWFFAGVDNAVETAENVTYPVETCKNFGEMLDKVRSIVSKTE